MERCVVLYCVMLNTYYPDCWNHASDSSSIVVSLMLTRLKRLSDKQLPHKLTPDLHDLYSR